MLPRGGAVGGATVTIGRVTTVTSANGEYTATNVVPGAQTLAARGHLLSLALSRGQYRLLWYDKSEFGARHIREDRRNDNRCHRFSREDATIAVSGGILLTSVTVKTNSKGQSLTAWIPRRPLARLCTYSLYRAIGKNEFGSH
jgi:hypothetical protein